MKNRSRKKNLIFGYLIATCLSGVVLMGCTSSPEFSNHSNVNSVEQRALDVIKARNNAYNAHNIDSFLAVYDEKVKIYTYPDKLMGEGVERLLRIFGPQFQDRDGVIKVHSQQAIGNIVMVDATESFFGIEQRVIAIYTVREGQIIDLRLIEPENEK